MATTEFLIDENGLMTEKSVRLAARRGAALSLDPLTQEAHVIMVKTYTSLTTAVRRNNPSSLSLGRYNVLRLLYSAEGQRLLMSEIGDGLEVSPTVVTRLVDSLVNDGLVRRVDHPDDKRKTWAEITDGGVALLEAEMPLMMALVEELWKGIAPEEKQLLIHVLSKLRLNLLTSAARDTARRTIATLPAGEP
jgi:DNA-binding MarR family transcriptional regulator